MARPISHQLDVYGCWLHLTTDRRAWSTLRRTIKSLDPKPADAAGSLTHVQHWSPPPVHYTSHYVVHIDVQAARDDADLVDTIAHEATHAASQILDDIGQRVAPDEALAYLVGWITGWIWQGVRP